MNGLSYNNNDDLTLSQIVRDDFHAAAVLEKYHLDFCCKGSRLFNEACKEKGLSGEEILHEIKNQSGSQKDEAKFNKWQLDFLIEYIVNNHHKYIRESGPVIDAHIEKVAAVHGKNHPETIETAKLFSIIYKDLRQHLMKEEEILFPYIKYLVKIKNENAPVETPYFGTIANPIRMMEAEHQSAGDIFERIRILTNNFALPDDACNTYKVSYSELNEFELDLHRHVHLENNILFPKAIELEKEIFEAGK